MIEDLRARMMAAAPVTSLIATRLYPTIRPQGTQLPSAALQMISSAPDYHLEGPSGYEAERVQVNAYGQTYRSAEGVAKAIKAAVSGWSGTQGATEFRGVFVEGERADYEPGLEEGSAVHRIILDLMIHHRSAS